MEWHRSFEDTPSSQPISEAQRLPPVPPNPFRQRSLSLLSTVAVHENERISPASSLHQSLSSSHGNKMTANLSPRLANLDLEDEAPWGGMSTLYFESMHMLC